MKWAAFIIGSFLLYPILSQGEEVINGHYCYTYGDNESLKEAREMTKALASLKKSH